MSVDRNEIRRLEKAAKDKDKRKLGEWANQFEFSIRQELERKYEKYYQDQVMNAIDNLCIAMAFTAHFSEVTKLGSKRLPEFMEDMFITVDMFRTGEYNPLDYKEELEKAGISIDKYTYRHIDDEEKKRKVIESWQRKSNA